MSRASAARGFTLVELVVSIVIISIAAMAVIGVLSDVSARSGESMVQEQAIQIASAYLNEVLLRPVNAPGGGPGTPRNQYVTVGEYNGLVNVGARDQYNNPIPGLSQFTVTVQVTTPPAGALKTVPQASMRLVTVTVTEPIGVLVVLSGYRTDYP